MSIKNGIIEENSPLGGELFSFFGVGKGSNGLYNWGSLPYSNIINPRSKHKPVDYLYDDMEKHGSVLYCRRTQLTEEQRKRINYGHTYEPYQNALRAIQAIAGNTFFPYNRPHSWFRPADFWGYDHNTVSWFKTLINKKETAKITKGSVVSIVIEDLEEVFTLGALSGYNKDLMNLGFLIWSEEYSETQPQVYFMSLTDIRDATKQLTSLTSGDGFKLNTSEFSVDKTYRLYPCLTTYAQFDQHVMYIEKGDDAYAGQYFPLPFCNTFLLEIVSSGGDTDVINNIHLVNNDVDIRVIDSTSLTYGLWKLGVYFTNISSSSYETLIKWEIKDVYNQVNKPAVQSATILLEGNTAEDNPQYVELYISEDSPYRFEIGNTLLEIDITYIIHREDYDETKTETLEIQL